MSPSRNAVKSIRAWSPGSRPNDLDGGIALMIFAHAMSRFVRSGRGPAGAGGGRPVVVEAPGSHTGPSRLRTAVQRLRNRLKSDENLPMNSRSALKVRPRGADNVVVRATRAYVAGLGTAGALVLAAVLAFALAGTLVAFNGWSRLASGGS